MELKEAFTRSLLEVFGLFKVRPQFPPETNPIPVSSEEQICVVISFTQVLKGKVIFQFNKSLGEKIASIVKETHFESFDEVVKAALCEIMSFISTLALGKYIIVRNVFLLPSILIKGEDLTFMISGAKANNLVCQLFDDYISITYCLE